MEIIVATYTIVTIQIVHNNLMLEWINKLTDKPFFKGIHY